MTVVITPILKTGLHNQNALECIITYSVCMFIHWTCVYNIIIYKYKEELKTVVRELLAWTQPNGHKTFTALWKPYRVPLRGRRVKICFSRGSRVERTENDRPPFWFYGESIRTSGHGNGNNAQVADSVVAYDQGCKVQESLRCKVIVWDEATMSNKLALEGVERTFQDIREISAPLVAVQWSSVEIYVMCK